MLGQTSLWCASNQPANSAYSTNVCTCAVSAASVGVVAFQVLQAVLSSPMLH
jgi:hypothetical protein